ncbi:MAG: MarR family transcriptional regulator [Sneathiella sp.]
MYRNVTERCAGVRVLSAARSMTRLFDAALRPTGLTITQFTLLITIGRTRPESVSKIGTWLNIDRTSLTRNIKLLEEAGYVTRGAEGPGRRRRIQLNQAGHDILQAAYPKWLAVQERIEAELSEEVYDNTMASLGVLNKLEA